MLNELDMDTDEFFQSTDPRGESATYWHKNYARMTGYLRSFRELTLDDSITIYEVSQMQEELASAMGYIADREQQVRKRLKIRGLRNLASGTPYPEEAASALAKADALEGKS